MLGVVSNHETSGWRGIEQDINGGYDGRQKRKWELVMSKLIVEGNLPAQLRQLTQPVQLCDASGQVLGQFFPNVDLSQWDTTEPPPLSEDEKRRRLANDRRLTTAELLAELEKL
jgi:hypothetical protein